MSLVLSCGLLITTRLRLAYIDDMVCYERTAAEDDGGRNVSHARTAAVANVGSNQLSSFWPIRINPLRSITGAQNGVDSSSEQAVCVKI